MDPRHPILSAKVFSSNAHIGFLRENILVGEGMCFSKFISYYNNVSFVGSCAVTGMKASGLPPHLAVTGKVAAVMRDLEVLGKRLEDLKVDLPATVSVHIRENFEINGAVTLSLSEFNRFAEEMRGVRL